MTTSSTTSTGSGPTTSGNPPTDCDTLNVICTTQVYFGDCSQFPGKRSLWTFLSYDTTVPSDARVEFAVRTAESEAELAGSFAVAGVATMDSELVPPSVPIHLSDVLLGAEVVRPYLELRVMRVPSSDGTEPSVEGWDLLFTCEDV